TDDADAGFFERAEEAVRAVRQSRAPGFLVVHTQRLGPHSKGDDLRDAEEMAAIKERDPLARLGDRLTAGTRAAIDAANGAFMQRVRAEAEASAPARETTRRAHVFGGTQANPALATRARTNAATVARTNPATGA